MTSGNGWRSSLPCCDSTERLAALPRRRWSKRPTARPRNRDLHLEVRHPGVEVVDSRHSSAEVGQTTDLGLEIGDTPV
jgi:hypothetical protein